MKKSLNKKFLVPSVITGGFLTFVGIRMATLNTDLAVILDYTPPKSDFVGIDFTTTYGQWAVTLNGKTIAMSEGELAPAPTASTAKMILSLAVMEKKPFNLGEAGETITITQEMYDKYLWYYYNNGSNSAVRLGEEISEYDALVSTMLVSSNNMADSLAIWAFGSLDEYRSYATEMLGRMGINHTTIGPDASGYNEGTISTADDLAKIGDALLKQPVLAEIVGKTEAVVPVAGKIENTNKLLGQIGIVGVKTGYIGDASGYNLVSGYRERGSIITLALMGAPTRAQSFDDSKAIIQSLQSQLGAKTIVASGTEVGHYDSWWTGKVAINAAETQEDVVFGDLSASLEMNGISGILNISSDYNQCTVPVSSEELKFEPSFWERFLRVFGWSKE